MVALKIWGLALRNLRFIIKCENANSVLALNSGHFHTGNATALPAQDLVPLHTVRL